MHFQQVGPADAWKFRHIVYVVMSVGTVASIIFHFSVKEKYSYASQAELIHQSGRGVHLDFLHRPILYQVHKSKFVKIKYNFLRDIN